MLIFKRYANEAIIIGKGDQKIVVKILSVGSRAVKVGIAAPAEVQVDRDEYRRELEEQEKLVGGES